MNRAVYTSTDHLSVLHLPIRCPEELLSEPGDQDECSADLGVPRQPLPIPLYCECARVRVHVHVHACINICVCVCVYVCVNTIVRACVCMSLRVYITYVQYDLSRKIPLSYSSQVEYNHQKMEVDARLRKAVIPNLQPDTDYDFKITSPEGNMGRLRHRILAKTSPLIGIRRPEIDHTRDTETTITIILPSLENRSPVK